MDNEQNISDLLKLLEQQGFDGKDDFPSNEKDVKDADINDISHDELQALLKEKYLGNASSRSDEEKRSEYKLDESFFAETEIVEEKAIEEEIIEEEVIEEEAIEEEIIEEEIIEEEVIEEKIIEEEIIEEKILEEESIEKKVFLEKHDDNKSEQLSFFEDSIPFDDDDNIESDSFYEDDAFDEGQIVLDFGDTYEDLDPENIVMESSNIDTSFLGLMREVSENVPIGKSSSVDPFNDASSEDDLAHLDLKTTYGFKGEEYSEQNQEEDIKADYLANKKSLLLRLVFCGALTLLLAVFELLPHLSVKLGGIFDYTRYPAAYLFFGVQLLVGIGAFAWRELWSGFKRAFCYRSDIWSLSSLMLLGVTLYEVALAILPRASLPKTFGTVAALYVLLGLLSEYLELIREIRSFDVYSHTGDKYTLETEPIASSAAEKMYREGVPGTVNIFEARKVAFPKGYFAEVNRTKPSDVLINSIVTPTVLASAVIWVVSMLLGASLVRSLEVFMISLAALFPMAIFASRVLPVSIASKRLYENGSAVAGETSAKKYASCNIMVYKDTCLFRPSKAEECGIVVYNSADTKKVVEYLASLYGAIGGPMKDVFAEHARNKYEPDIRRIARTGIEAVINRQVVILGDLKFQNRYGITFNDVEKSEAGDGLLCLSIGGKPAARLCLRYFVDPEFEKKISIMKEGDIECAVETYDPVISAAYVAARRKKGSMPIKVVHKNANDYKSQMPENVEGNTGLVTYRSKLALVDCVAWCKRMLEAKRACASVHLISIGITLAALLLMLFLGFDDKVNQYTVLLLQAIAFIPTLAVLLKKLSSKNGFGEDNSKK